MGKRHCLCHPEARARDRQHGDNGEADNGGGKQGKRHWRRHASAPKGGMVSARTPAAQAVQDTQGIRALIQGKPKTIGHVERAVCHL